MKECTSCKQTKPLRDYYVNRETEQIFSRCMECQRAAALRRYYERKRAAQMNKVERGYKVCGSCKKKFELNEENFAVATRKTQRLYLPHEPSYWVSDCRECMRERSRHYRKAKLAREVSSART